MILTNDTQRNLPFSQSVNNFLLCVFLWCKSLQTVMCCTNKPDWLIENDEWTGPHHEAVEVKGRWNAMTEQRPCFPEARWGVLLPESTRRSPTQEADLSGNRGSAHGNKKNKKKSSAPQQGTTTLTLTNPHADTDGAPYHMRASFIKAKHKTGHTLRCEHSCVNPGASARSDWHKNISKSTQHLYGTMWKCFSVMPHDPYLSVDPVFLPCFYLFCFFKFLFLTIKNYTEKAWRLGEKENGH